MNSKTISKLNNRIKLCCSRKQLTAEVPHQVDLMKISLQLSTNLECLNVSHKQSQIVIIVAYIREII